MHIKIRDWDSHFEQDRTRQWKHLKWVPIPNKQGSGYRKIMKQKNGLEIFGCWIAIIEVASQCNPRGDCSKHNLETLSDLTLIDSKKLKNAIEFLSKSLDWIEVIENLDVSVKKIDKCALEHAVSSSIQFNSIQFNSLNSPDKNQSDMETKSSLFESWYSFYPKKVSRGKAESIWERFTLQECKTIAPLIIEALKWQSKSEDWTKENRKFVPHPGKYLTDKRWLDVNPNYKSESEKIFLRCIQWQVINNVNTQCLLRNGHSGECVFKKSLPKQEVSA